jgi:tetratricopeptide (TPR) repeat protein
MFRTSFKFLLLLAFLRLPNPILLAQTPGMGGGRPVGGIIDVQVRYADGRPGPRGIHVRLEAAEGGAEADMETVQGGKCQFREPNNGVFIVRIVDSNYKEVSARVEIIGSPMAYVVLNLVPLQKDPNAPADVIVPQPSADRSVSVKDLTVPDQARQEVSKGEEALTAKNAGEGIKHFEKAIKIYPDYPQAYRLLGEAYLQKQDWQQAESALKHSIELEPKLSASYLDLGTLYNQNKDYPAAESALKKCLEISPDSPAAQYELAKTYFATGRWQDAAPLAESSVKTLPDLAPAHVLLANIRLKQRDAPGALHEYQEYLRLEPDGSLAPQVRDMVAKLQKALGQ